MLELAYKPFVEASCSGDSGADVSTGLARDRGGAPQLAVEELVVTVPGCTRSKCAGCLLRPNVATCVVKPQGSKVTVIEVDGKALMLASKLSLSRRAINGGTCGHPCVAWQIFTGPSRRRTSPKVSLNTSVTPGFMMFSRCLLLSNSHEANTGISVSHLELRLHFGKRRLRPDVQALAAAIHGTHVEGEHGPWE